MRPALRTVVIACVVGLTSLAGSTRAVAVPVVPNGGLAGNGTVTVQATADGRLMVTAWSAPVTGRVAVVVSNGTNRTVRVQRVDATATNADGSGTSRASSGSVVPSVLRPGQWGIGAVRFRQSTVGADDGLAFKVRARRARSGDPVPLAAGSFTLSPPHEGPVAQTLAFVVSNGSRRLVVQPYRTSAVCLDEAGRLTTESGAVVRRPRTLAADATAPASIGFPTLCPVYVVGAEATRGR